MKLARSFNIFGGTLIIFIIGGQSQILNEKDSIIVPTKSGWLQGKIIRNLGSRYYSFKGIPYAEPPIGKYRFQAAVPIKKWKGVRPAFEHGSICANKFGILLPSTIGGSEDCLFLNVYTPRLIKNLAVMFFIHGGSFVTGNGDSIFYGPEHLVKDVVVVTINYRLNSFGFFSTGDENAPGNQGLKDIVLALKWVKDNIKFFGGDPKKVTIFGESAGATAIHYLLMSEMANGLYDKVILQSGSAFMPWCFQPDPKAQADKFAKRLNINYTDSKDLVDKLTNLDVKELIDAEIQIEMMEIPSGMRPYEFVPTAEPKNSKNAFLTETPISRMLSGNYQKVPMMIGHTDFEAMYYSVLYNLAPVLLQVINSDPNYIVPIAFTTNDTEKLIKDLQNLYFNGKPTATLFEWLKYQTDQHFRSPSNRLANFYANSSNFPIYYYEFTFDGALNVFKKGLVLDMYEGACHADDLLYLFEGFNATGLIADERSMLMRDRMTKMWTNFAKLGNPTPTKDSLITEIWKPYDLTGKFYFKIDETLENRQHLAGMDAMNDLYLKYIGHF